MSVWDFMLPHHCKLDLNYKIANKEKTLSPSSRIPKVKTLASYYFWRSPVSMTMMMISFLNPKKCQATNPQCTIPISPSMFHVRNHGVEITTGTRIAGAIRSTTHFWGHKEGTLRKKKVKCTWLLEVIKTCSFHPPQPICHPHFLLIKREIICSKDS